MKQGRPSLREKVLAALPGTRAQIEKKSGVSSSTVGKWLAILRKEKACHIGKWRRSRSSKKPVFVIGPGADAKPIKTLTMQESMERFDKKNPNRRKEIKSASQKRCRERKKCLQKGIFATLFMAANNET